MKVGGWGSFNIGRADLVFLACLPGGCYGNSLKFSGGRSGSGPENISSGSASGRHPHN